MPEKDKSKTDEEKKSPEQVATINLGLESYLNVAGQNKVRKHKGRYGELVSDSAEKLKFSGSKEFQQTREQIEKQEQAIRDQTGYAGPYSGASNDSIVFGMYQTTRHSLAIVKMGDLEKILKDNGAKLDFEVPEKLRELSKEKIIEKAKEKGMVDRDGRIDIGKLEETYKDAFIMQQLLGEAYDILGAKKIVEGIDFYADINAQGKAIAEKYSTKKGE